MRALALLALLSATPVWAGGGAASLVTAGDLHGHFVQEKRVSGLSHPLKSRGDFVLMKGRGLVWRTLEPLQGTVVLGAAGVWALDAAGGSRRLAGGGEALELMSKLLGQDPAALKSLFEVVPVTLAAGFRAVLTPRSPVLRKLFRTVTISGSRPGRLSRAELKEADGDATLIRFVDLADGPGPLSPAEEALLAP